jgi:hypothetical protein
MDPVVKQLLRRRDPVEPSDAERLRAMEAYDIAQRALEKIAVDSLARGRGGRDIGRKPPTPRDEQVAPESTSQERREAQPRTQPPAGAVGDLARKGAGLDWDVRALDPRIRSDRAADAGRVEVVINSRYPLYRRRGGDLEYMLETGLMEQLKPGPGDELAVEQYHEQLVDALSAALAELGLPR